jgi:hypothetical protein
MSWYETEENLNKLVKVVGDVVHNVGEMDVDEMSINDMEKVFTIIEKEMEKEFPSK